MEVTALTWVIAIAGLVLIGLLGGGYCFVRLLG